MAQLDNPDMAKFVYLFSDVGDLQKELEGDWDRVRSVLGGKGASLADMTRIGVPVPPGFTVSTEACRAFLENDRSLPETVWDQELAAVHALEEATGKKLGDPEAPLLLSCRSGAKFSMPGMMDTILDIGLNDEVAEARLQKGHDARFVYDCYRRLVQMFGGVVLGVEDETFEILIEAQRRRAGVRTDAEMGADDWKTLVTRFKEIIRVQSGNDFPSDPYQQLRAATEAVFDSWDSKRAHDYRKAAGISHSLGTAVNIQAMVFGNIGEDSATGVAMSRNASTGEPMMEGDFLINAQGEDVVAGIRTTLPLTQLKETMPSVFAELEGIASKLEKHYCNMQDMEFTIERGKLWLLQTRDGKRTAQAEVRIAVDMVEEGMIDRNEAVRRVTPEQIDFFLHPRIEESARRSAQRIARGLNVSPGAGVGVVAFDPNVAERWAKEDGKKVILVRAETKPDDVHGMLAAQGIVTARGGRTSHAALVARQFGKPAVVGVEELEIAVEERLMRVQGDLVIEEGDWISVDGTTGEIFLGELPTLVPDFTDEHLLKILAWADEIRRLEVWANGDDAKDAARARLYGAEGIGLCRTEHMFFDPERLPVVRQMITAENKSELNEALDKLLPLQSQDFEGMFKAMDGCPVTIRLLDPPLHEFLPPYDELIEELADLKLQLQHQSSMGDLDRTLAQIRVKTDFLERVRTLREMNPMLGTRGVRLGILVPELFKMQVRAIFESACRCASKGIEVHPHVMIPLTCHVNELKVQQRDLEQVASQVMENFGIEIPCKFGTMIEVPRAALTAGELATYSEFFSFGTNDLTQTVYGISRDDAESGFLIDYIAGGILPENPFETLDQAGVGQLMRQAIEMGRESRPDIQIGICGEHGGDPKTIHFCHKIGLDYVSCSPFRIPVARLAAAHAALEERTIESESKSPHDLIAERRLQSA